MQIFSSTVILAALELLAQGVAAQNPKESICCSALAGLPGFESKVLTPSSDRYTSRLSEYYSANAAQAPWCMVFPENTEDVSELTKVLNESQCPFGMRSGAHSAFAGSNGIRDGVTVDFGNMKSTSYDEDTEVARIQPGATWGDAYQALAPYGVIAIGGRADVVGVGGFTTGGGYSFHTGVRGFACDNVKNFEVVLGDGSIVNANAEENSDLWKALKGGSGNFGFVTRIDTEVFPSSEIYASLNSFNNARKPELRQAYFDFVNVQDQDPASQVIVSTVRTSTSLTSSAILSNVDAEISDSFDAFFEYESETNISITGPAHEVVPTFTGPTPLGLFANWQTGMVAHDLRIMEAMDEIVLDYLERMEKAAPEADFEMIFQWQPVTKGIVDVMESRGGNVMGLDAVVADGPALMYNIVFTVDTAANQGIVLPLAFEMNQELLKTANDMGLNRNWEFLNYAHSSQNPLSHYGAENLAFMKEVSRSYDPNQVFQKLRQTGFRLPA